MVPTAKLIYNTTDEETLLVSSISIQAFESFILRLSVKCSSLYNKELLTRICSVILKTPIHHGKTLLHYDLFLTLSLTRRTSLKTVSKILDVLESDSLGTYCKLEHVQPFLLTPTWLPNPSVLILMFWRILLLFCYQILKSKLKFSGNLSFVIKDGKQAVHGVIPGRVAQREEKSHLRINHAAPWIKCIFGISRTC